MEHGKRMLLGLTAILFTFAQVSPVLAQRGGGYGGYGGYGGWGQGMMGGFGGGGWFGSIFMLIFWGLIIVGLVLLIRWLVFATRRGEDPARGGSRAMDILKERYARGEIDREEFEQRRRDLK